MSPVFRHGMLRLYLLRLLDEEPRHGYEVIRQLRDQFMGVYAPSPGTIYPRLARLEEEGLVTHDEVDGRKVYRITEAGREELRKRGTELNELEAELHASVTDIVREVKEDVRETVRSLREELTLAARGMRFREEGQSSGTARSQSRSEAREEARTQTKPGRDSDQATREEAERSRGVRDEARAVFREKIKSAHSAHEQWRTAFREESGSAGSGPGEDFPGWPGWTEWGRWTDWPGRKHWHGPRDLSAFRDLERIAREFVGDLRKTALDSSALGNDVMANLRDILEETLERIRMELFGTEEEQKSAGDAPAEDTKGSAARSESPEQ
jgi:DNA-binding PadR family transcriptional regulator